MLFDNDPNGNLYRTQATAIPRRIACLMLVISCNYSHVRFVGAARELWAAAEMRCVILSQTPRERLANGVIVETTTILCTRETFDGSHGNTAELSSKIW